MAVNGVEIQCGQIWATRSGARRVIKMYDRLHSHPWLAACGHRFSHDGVAAIMDEYGLDNLVVPVSLEAELPLAADELPMPTRAPADSPLAAQVGGDHYRKLAIQPIEYIHANSIPFAEGNVIKYVTRWRDKGGLADLRKAKHFLELLIELETKAGAQ